MSKTTYSSLNAFGTRFNASMILDMSSRGSHGTRLTKSSAEGDGAKIDISPTHYAEYISGVLHFEVFQTWEFFYSSSLT